MERTYERVRLDERCEIYRLHTDGKSLRDIRRSIGRSASTVSRELKWNRLPRSGYKPASAQRMAMARKGRVPKIERSSQLDKYHP